MKKLLILLVLLSSCKKDDIVEVPVYEGDLTPAQVHILLLKGTDPAYIGPLVDEDRPGVYLSWTTGEVLFTSEYKKLGLHAWPYFTEGTDKISNRWDSDGSGRMETIETSNETHLGHYLQNFDGTWYYCINGTALNFIPN